MHLTRSGIAIVVLLTGSQFLLAQPPIEPKDGKIVVPLAITPAEAQQPLSRNYLLPEYKDSIPGNQVQMFLRCFMEQDLFFGKDESMRREKLNSMPLADLPAEELNNYGGNLLGRDLVDATRMLNVDWQLWTFLRRDGVGTLLPDVQKIRQLAWALKTRGRGQIRNRDFPGAIITLRTMFALAHAMDSNPCLVGNFVGIAIANNGCDLAEELIQQPGCPNLYWSFADLPAPFINLRIGIQGERVVWRTHFNSVLQGPLSEKQLNQIFKTIDDFEPLVGKGIFNNSRIPFISNAKARYVLWAVHPERLKLARARLMDTGVAEEMIKEMPPLQLVLADDFRQLEVYQDEIFKWVKQPEWESGRVKEVQNELEKEKDNLLLAPILLPAFLAIKQEQTRLQQRLDSLQIIEAVRLHAHQNKGGLPAALEEIKLPLPLDPAIGKSFSLTQNDGVITLSGAKIGTEPSKPLRFYEIRLKK